MPPSEQIKQSKTAVGRYAEKLVANYMHSRGYSIIHMNWRTKLCEIDIISRKGTTVYFVEVRFCSRSYISGFDTIDYAKRSKMKFAFRIWLSQNTLNGCSFQLVAAEVWKENGQYKCRFLRLED